MFLQDGNALIFKKKFETVRIESWGKNALRIRATKNNEFTGNLYGMGVYQNPFIELKGTTLELAQRNAQTSVPFEIRLLYPRHPSNPSLFLKRYDHLEIFGEKYGLSKYGSK